MKKLLLVLALVGFSAPVFAEQTTGEKVDAAGNKVKRSAKKGANRVKEAVCMEGDVKCAAEKAGHRIEEGADAVKDGAKKTKDKID